MGAFAMVQRPELVLPMAAVTAVLYGLSGLPIRVLRQRLGYPGLFILAVVMSLPFSNGETVLGQWGAIRLRREGLEATALIVGRFLSIFSLGLILLGTTPFFTLVHSLRRLGVPPLMADMGLLTYRYLHDLGDRLGTMYQAMQLRGLGSHAGAVRRRSLQSFALLVGNLLLRSYEQSERVYKAMVLRGYGQEIAEGKRLLAVTVTKEGLGLTVTVLAIAVGFMAAEGVL